MKKNILYSLFLVLFALIQGCSSLNERLPEKLKMEGIKQEESPLKMVWAKNIDPIYNTGNLPIAVHSVEIYEGILYAGHNSGYMVAYDLKNGRELWRKKDNGAYNSGPIVYEQMLIYGNRQGRIYARDYLTGELIYSVDLDGSVETRPVIKGGRLFVHLRNHKIFALDAMSGGILWAYRRSVPFTTTIQGVSRPLIVENQLIVGFADGSITSLNIEDGVLLWESRLSQGSKFVDVDMRPKVFRDFLFASSLAGELKLLEPQTGNILRRLDITPSRSPLEIPGENLLIGTSSGELVKMNRHFEVIQSIDLGSTPVTGYFVWKEGFIVTMASREVYWVDTELSTKRTVFDMGHAHSAVLSEPKVEEGHFAFISSRNRIYVFK